MKRESLVFFLGFVVALLPFLGIPNLWKRTALAALGGALVLVGYQLRRLAYLRSIEDHTGERKTDVYVEQVAVAGRSPEADTAAARAGKGRQKVGIGESKLRRGRGKDV